jgi:hypothetical protein
MVRSRPLCLAAGGGKAEGRDPQLARAALRSARAVLFDVDSTVSTEEGIDVLAASLGAEKAKAVEEWTRKVGGGVGVRKWTCSAFFFFFFFFFVFFFFCCFFFFFVLTFQFSPANVFACTRTTLSILSVPF